MRDSLIELFEKAFDEYGKNNFPCSVSKYLADYLLASDVIVPPCKIGQTVYHIYCGNNLVTERVIAFGVDSRGLFYTNDDYREIPCIKFGKTVFLTREEAEAALKDGGTQCVK